MKDYISDYDTNEDILKAMLVEHGPVVTSVDATDWQFLVEANSTHVYDTNTSQDPYCCDAASEKMDCW